MFCGDEVWLSCLQQIYFGRNSSFPIIHLRFSSGRSCTPYGPEKARRARNTHSGIGDWMLQIYHFHRFKLLTRLKMDIVIPFLFFHTFGGWLPKGTSPERGTCFSMNHLVRHVLFSASYTCPPASESITIPECSNFLNI